MSEAKVQTLLVIVDGLVALGSIHATKKAMRLSDPNAVSQADVEAARAAYEKASRDFRLYLADNV